jgi:phenylacetate-coenzyme A ligase PaaK-like adenylate-forming protein
VCVTTYASSAVRVAVAARERGIDLRGVCFITLGEPYTDAKRAVVEAAGARAVPRYAFTEGGVVGYGCASPRSADDMHVMAHALAIVHRRRPTPGGDVDALLFTSLSPSAPKVLLNVETGDTARLERRPCGCPMDALGLRDHVADITSFEKLSGEGISFAGVDLIRVLEEALPARIGGSGGDYQLVEDEDAHGILRTVLIVSPPVGAVDEERVREVFLEALGATGGAERIGTDLWRRAETVRIRRQWPVPTGAGKVLPFHVARSRAAAGRRQT